MALLGGAATECVCQIPRQCRSPTAAGEGGKGGGERRVAAPICLSRSPAGLDPGGQRSPVVLDKI